MEKLSKSRKARIGLMVLAFLLVGTQWYLIVGMFNYMFSGTMITNLLDNVVGRPLVDWLVWLLYGAFAVVVPLYFRIRGGKTTPNTGAIWASAILFNIVGTGVWTFYQGSLAQFSAAISILIMATFVNSMIAVALFVLLIYKLFPD